MFKKRNISSELMGHRDQHGKGNVRAQKHRWRTRKMFQSSGIMGNEDLARWRPINHLTYAGYRSGTKSDEPERSGKVIIHLREAEYIGGFYIEGASVKIWYHDGYIKKEINIPTILCVFTKRREGSVNIYDVVIDNEKLDILFGKGVTMTEEKKNGVTDYKPFKENIGWWDRLLKTTDPVYWKKTIQTELDTRWTTFDNSSEKLASDFEKFNRQAMEITEAENNMESTRREWAESLTSLGNLLNKNTTHEKGMWDITQNNKQNRSMKIKQKFIRAGVDEMNFNSMMDYIKQYPELQAQRTIEKMIGDVKEKRDEVIAADKKYAEIKKEANTYLNMAKNKLQEVGDELASFEKMKTEGEQKVNDAQFKGLKNKLLNWNKTEAEKQSTRLDMFKYDRKIDVSKNQLKLISQRIEKYESRTFTPTVTKRFKDIEDS